MEETSFSDATMDLYERHPDCYLWALDESDTLDTHTFHGCGIVVYSLARALAARLGRNISGIPPYENLFWGEPEGHGLNSTQAGEHLAAHYGESEIDLSEYQN